MLCCCEGSAGRFEFKFLSFVVRVLFTNINKIQIKSNEKANEEEGREYPLIMKEMVRGGGDLERPRALI